MLAGLVKDRLAKITQKRNVIYTIMIGSPAVPLKVSMLKRKKCLLVTDYTLITPKVFYSFSKSVNCRMMYIVNLLVVLACVLAANWQQAMNENANLKQTTTK